MRSFNGRGWPLFNMLATQLVFFWPWLGLKAMALARLCLALAAENIRSGQKPCQSHAGLWPESQQAMAFTRN
jgi:hypothetical protein